MPYGTDRPQRTLSPFAMAPPPIYQGPQFPFSRTLISGPLGKLLAGAIGAPADLRQINTPALEAAWPGVALPPSYSPNEEQITRAMEQQMKDQPAPSYSSLWTMLPELSMALRAPPMTPLPWVQNLFGK